ncbi:hypothetical protein RUM44_012727 [Polyplax serrata]|uniref:Uncharacterized protein n=1 Tax=Polyplax serrata TaxID=468196 RepID=A0ABR1BC48_POLSC
MTGLNVELKPQKEKENRNRQATPGVEVVACDGNAAAVRWRPNFPLRRGKQHVLMENEKENLKATTKIKESFPSHPERIPKSEEKVPEAGDRGIPGRCHGA